MRPLYCTVINIKLKLNPYYPFHYVFTLASPTVIYYLRYDAKPTSMYSDCMKLNDYSNNLILIKIHKKKNFFKVVTDKRRQDLKKKHMKEIWLLSI